jgi:hypothetical protein
MTKVYIADTTNAITVQDAVYTVQVASAASDTTVTTSGSGTSLINTSTGGNHVLNSVTGGANVTITDDNAGNLTIAATDTEDNLTNNDTDDLSEGSTNQYFTDARVMTSLETVSGNIIPDGDNTRSLGSATKEWKEVFIGPGSLYIDGHKVLGSDDTDTINFTSDTGQTMDFFAGGTSGSAGVINMASRGNTTTFNDTTVNLGPSGASGTINARGTLEAPDLHVGALELEATLLNNTGSNQNLELRTNGTGYVHLNSADVYFGPIAGAVKIDEGSITTTAGNLTIGAFGTVDVAGHNTTSETAALIATAKTEANTYADAAVGVLTSGASAAFDTLVEIKTLMDSGDATLNTAIGNLNHDTLSGFVANEHIDWTTDQGSTNIHAGNYTDTDTVFTSANAISAVEGESTLDLTGTVKVGDLEFTNYTQFGEDFGKLKATGSGQNLMMEADGGTAYFLVKSPNIYFGAASGVKVTNAAGAATTISGFGYQSEALNITGNLTGPVIGNVTGNVHGNIDTAAITTSTTNEDIAVTTNGTGTFNVDKLEIGDGVAYGQAYAKLEATDTNQYIELKARQGSGYVWANSPMIFLGGDSGVKIGKFGQSYNQLISMGADGLKLIGELNVTDINAPATPIDIIKKLNFDHSGSNGDLNGNGLNFEFSLRDQAGTQHQMAANLCKMIGVSTGGSAGSATITDYHGEYTLTTEERTAGGGMLGGLNALTVNKNFTQATNELRVTNTLRGSGSTQLSGLYLTNNTPSGNAQTGTPSAKIQLRNQGADTTTSLIELSEGKVDFKKVVNLASNTTSEQNALTGAAGDMLFNSTTSKFMGYNGSAWVELG